MTANDIILTALAVMDIPTVSEIPPDRGTSFLVQVVDTTIAVYDGSDDSAHQGLIAISYALGRAGR